MTNYAILFQYFMECFLEIFFIPPVGNMYDFICKHIIGQHFPLGLRQLQKNAMNCEFRVFSSSFQV